jgi:hypothetical protein
LVQLDVGAVPGVAVAGFDHVGIERAPGKELRAFDASASPLERVDELLAYCFALLLRVVTPFQALQKLLCSRRATCRSM